MRKTAMIAVASVALLGSAAAGWATTAQPDAVTAYQQSLDRACQAGLYPGPDAYRLYQQAHRVAPSLPDPGLVAEECFEAP